MTFKLPEKKGLVPTIQRRSFVTCAKELCLACFHIKRTCFAVI